MEEFNVLSSEPGAIMNCKLVEAGGDFSAGRSECGVVQVSELDAASIPEGSI